MPKDLERSKTIVEPWTAHVCFTPSPYQEVDEVIDGLLLGTGWKLHTEWADHPVRCFEIPADPPLECFQLSVSPPLSGEVTVFAAAVDKAGDTEVEESWRGPVSELNPMLAEAISLIEEWRGALHPQTTARGPLQAMESD